MVLEGVLYEARVATGFSNRCLSRTQDTMQPDKVLLRKPDLLAGRQWPPRRQHRQVDQGCLGTGLSRLDFSSGGR